MLSQAQICNMALIEVGGGTITSLDDDTTEALSCRALWDVAVESLLYRHQWNFAMKRADLGAALADTPAFEYDYKYSLPADCVRVWEFYGKPTSCTWVVENGEFLTNEDEEIYIRYISRETTVSKFSAWFSFCLSLAIAAALAVKLGKGDKRRQELLMELEGQLLHAYVMDAHEGNHRKMIGENELADINSSWASEGR